MATTEEKIKHEIEKLSEQQVYAVSPRNGVYFPGVTYRQWLAAMAMQGFVSNQSEKILDRFAENKDRAELALNVVARLSNLIADEMIEFEVLQKIKKEK